MKVPEPRLGGSTFQWGLVIFLVIVGLAIIFPDKKTATLSSKSSTGPADYCTESQHASDYRYMEKAFGTGLLSNPSGGGRVLVADSLWDSMRFNEKERFAERFNCAIAGAGKALVRWEFRSDRDGRLLATWTGTRLSVD